MTFVPMLAVSFIMSVCAALFLICCVVLILIILIQKGKGGGLSGALAGGMAGGLLGTKTGDFLTWVTISLVGVFLLLAVIMAKFYKPEVGEFGGASAPQQQNAPQQVPPKSEAPAVPAQNAPTKPEAPAIPQQSAPANPEANVPGK